MTGSSPVVQTVVGPKVASELGTTLVHEHLIVDLRCYWSPNDDPGAALLPVSGESAGRIRANPFASRDNLVIDEPRLVAEELCGFRNAGGSTVVDVTPEGIGRDPVKLAWLAEQAGVNIIAGCGYYIKESHPSGTASRSRDELAMEMVRDLTEGIQGTRIRAGVIGELGMATSPMDPMERKVLEAAALAQQESGCAIVAHSAPGAESPFEVVEVLEKTGVDMTRVVQSHLDERFRANFDKYRRIADTGANLGLDTFGRELYYRKRNRQHPTDEDRIDTVVALLEVGLIDHILLSQDICLKHELSSYGGHGYDHVLLRMLPRLKERGVSDSELDQILRINPARVLTGSAPDSKTT